jgi:hypothetical protein
MEKLLVLGKSRAKVEHRRFEARPAEQSSVLFTSEQIGYGGTMAIVISIDSFVDLWRPVETAQLAMTRAQGIGAGDGRRMSWYIYSRQV